MYQLSMIQVITQASQTIFSRRPDAQCRVGVYAEDALFNSNNYNLLEQTVKNDSAPCADLGHVGQVLEKN
jgi:hypothetical protein